MSLRAAFLFIAPKANALQHTATVTTPEVEVVTVGVADYAAACQAASSSARFVRFASIVAARSSLFARASASPRITATSLS